MPASSRYRSTLREMMRHTETAESAIRALKARIKLLQCDDADIQRELETLEQRADQIRNQNRESGSDFSR